MNEFENFTMVKFKWNGDTHYGLFRKDSEESWIEICLVDENVHFEIIDISLVTDIKSMNIANHEDGIYGALIYYFCQNKIVNKEHESDFERFKKEYIKFLNIIGNRHRSIYVGCFDSIEEFQEKIHNQNYENGDYAFIKTVKINKDKTEEIICKRYDKISNDWIFSYDIKSK